MSFSRSGAELPFQVFADRYDRRSLLITSNLSFSDWRQILQCKCMTAALQPARHFTAATPTRPHTPAGADFDAEVGPFYTLCRARHNPEGCI